MAWENMRWGKTVGIALGQHEIAACKISGREGRWKIQRFEKFRLSTPLFAKGEENNALDSLTEGLRALRSALGPGVKQVHVSIPDPVVTLRLFELISLPKLRRQQLELMGWRFSKELGLEPDQMKYAFQAMGKRDGKHLIMGTAFSAPWFETICAGFRAEGLNIRVMDTDGCFRHNRFYHVLGGKQGGGVLVSLQPWSWSISAWDEQLRVNFLRSRWWGAGGVASLTEASKQYVMEEMEQAIRAHARNDPSNEVVNVFITGLQAFAASLADHLNRKMREKCLPIAADEDLGTNFPLDWTVENCLSPALAAGMKR